MKVLQANEDFRGLLMKVPVSAAVGRRDRIIRNRTIFGYTQPTEIHGRPPSRSIYGILTEFLRSIPAQVRMLPVLQSPLNI